MIIAEIGQNHCGDMELAKTLVSLAKQNGADLAKFQLYDHSELYKDHPEIPNVELTFEQAKMLFDYGKKINMEVFFSVFDVERVKWCEKIGVEKYKLAYSQKKNTKLRNAIEATGKPIVASTNDCNDVLFFSVCLYCVPKYPALITEYILSDGTYFDGVSDHTVGLDLAKIVLARDPDVIIEKHFALDHYTGVDAPWSMTPDELKELKEWETVCKQVL